MLSRVVHQVVSATPGAAAGPRDAGTSTLFNVGAACLPSTCSVRPLFTALLLPPPLLTLLSPPLCSRDCGAR